MRSILAAGAVLAVVCPAFAAVAHPPHPQASGAPTCTYSCPATDKSGFELVGTHPALTSTTVRCDYNFIQLDLTSYTCTYNTQTGALTKDNDGGDCRAAKQTCTSKRDVRDAEGQYEAYKRHLADRANAAALAVPKVISARAGLGKRRLLGKRMW